MKLFTYFENIIKRTYMYFSSFFKVTNGGSSMLTGLYDNRSNLDVNGKDAINFSVSEDIKKEIEDESLHPNKISRAKFDQLMNNFDRRLKELDEEEKACNVKDKNECLNDEILHMLDSKFEVH